MCFWQASRSSSNCRFKSVRLPFSKSKFFTSFVAASIWPSLTLNVFSAWAKDLPMSVFLIISVWIAFWKWAASLLCLLLVANKLAIEVCRSFTCFWASFIARSKPSRSLYASCSESSKALLSFSYCKILSLRDLPSESRLERYLSMSESFLVTLSLSHYKFFNSPRSFNLSAFNI